MLAQRTARYNDLEAELRTYYDALVTLESDQQEANTAKADAETIELQKQLEELRLRLAESKTQERELETGLTELREDLEKAYSELAEYETAALLEPERTQEDVAKDVLLRIGTSAVPTLIRLLDDERTDIRLFAASMLGEIGPDAEDAIPALREVLSDRNERVRAAAQRSLDLILD